MAGLIDRHASKIVGVLSCFDRIVIQETKRAPLSETRARVAFIVAKRLGR
jgi:hypothetical protein